jgi:hypothetical protein
VNTDFFYFESNTSRTLKPKFDANGVGDAGPLLMDFSTRKLRATCNDTLQVNANNELCTTLNCKGLKTGCVLSLDPTTKLLDFKYNTNSFEIKLNDEYELKTGNSYEGNYEGNFDIYNAALCKIAKDRCLRECGRGFDLHGALMAGDIDEVAYIEVFNSTICT